MTEKRKHPVDRRTLHLTIKEALDKYGLDISNSIDDLLKAIKNDLIDTILNDLMEGTLNDRFEAIMNDWFGENK